MATSTKIPVEDAIAQHCLAGRVRMLNRVITNIYDDALRPLGVKTSQLGILVATAKARLAKPAEVCHLLQLDTSTLSRNVDRMKANGWLEVVPDDDGRAQPFRLTAKGRKLLQRAEPAWQQAQKQATQILGDDAIAVINAAAARVRDRDKA